MAEARKPMTGAEVLAKLKSDPDFAARWKQRDALFEVLKRRLRIEEEPLLADLRAVGFDLNSVWQLGRHTRHYPQAIGVLLKHFLLPYSDRIREGIALALATPDARAAWPILVAEYRKAPIGYEVDEPSEITGGRRLATKGAIANALAATTTNDRIDELIALLRDRTLGETRVLLLRPLRRRKSPAVVQALRELSTDPELGKEIAAWKRRDLAVLQS